MKYARQTQEALDRLDQSLKVLRDLIKRNQNADAVRFMEEGPSKERFEDLQSIITISSTNTLGARSTSQTGNL